MLATDTTVHTRLADIRVRESSGQGLPIVLVHGSGGSMAVFAKQFETPLADAHRMVALDLPGHGESSDALFPTETYTIKGFAVVIGEVLDQLGIERAAVFGWSLGGHIAIELARWHPSVAGLMLTGTPPVSRGVLGMLRGFQTHRDAFLASKPHFTPSEVDRFAKCCFGDTGTPEFLDSIVRADGRARKILFNGMMRGIGADQRRVVEDAKFPVGVINGANETFARLSYLAGINYGNLWDGQCYVIEGAGHASFWEKPEIFNPLFFRFVEDAVAAEAELALGANQSLAHAV
jgi:pimeloyl-ACP methyl ester carboxylesterase